MKKIAFWISIVLCAALLAFASACTGSSAAYQLSPLPAPAPDSDNMFGIDKNINVVTTESGVSSIEEYLNRPDVAYFDVRMFYDPAGFSVIGGEANLTQTLPGYRVVPFPYLGTLSEMPVPNAYEGKCLYNIVWGADGGITSITPNYAESERIIGEIFPKDKAIFFMCGGGGYSALARTMLIKLGWDANKIYNTGANWFYTGDKGIDLKISSTNSEIATWRVDYAFIDFDTLTPR